MPTSLPRTQVTHTALVRHALDVAAKRWPGEKNGALLVHLIEEGARAVEGSTQASELDRRDRLRGLAEKFAEFYGPDYLDEIREGWNE
ncbi:hypothetical protein [Sinomonas sp. P47F7]|uniref:hypothetical protein n=1 Tax=Sinomonas sp. P47F7 TaxID=3410987 RepID=UPI003BF510EC